VERVVKLVGLGMSTGATNAADWWGALLAAFVEVPCPAPQLVRVDEAALETCRREVRDSAVSGMAFGVEYLPRASPAIGLESITGCVNHARALARAAALDTWIDVPDRMKPDFGRNLLVNTDDGQKELVLIDFGLAFGSALVPILGTRGDALTEMRDPLDPRVRSLIDKSELMSCIGTIEDISEADIVRVINTAPQEWVSDQMKGRVIAFLLARQRLIRPRLEEWTS
jgi:hypothetical protein